MLRHFLPMKELKKGYMMRFIVKFFIFLLLCLGMAHSTSAKIIVETGLDFEPNIKELLKDNIQYFYALGDKKEILKKFPIIKQLDHTKSYKKKDLSIFMSRSVFIINKPIGHFDHELAQNFNFLKTLMGEQKIEKLKNNSYLISVPGENKHQYEMRVFFDSDDISNTENKNSFTSINAIRTFDIFSKSNASFLTREISNYSKYAESGKIIQVFYPLTENKTLVTNYYLMFIKKPYGIKKVVLSNNLSEIKSTQSVLTSIPK